MKTYELIVTQTDELTGLSEDVLTAYHSDVEVLAEITGMFIDQYDSCHFYQLPLSDKQKEPLRYWTDNGGTYAMIKVIS